MSKSCFSSFIEEPDSGGGAGGLQDLDESVTYLAAALPAGNVLTIAPGVTLRNPLDKYTMVYLNGSLLVDDDYTRISNTQLTFQDTLSNKAIIKVRQYVL